MARRASKRQDTRSVDLRSGGKITVTLNLSAFDLTGADREFVNQLVDMIRDYEAASADRSTPRRASPARAQDEDKS